VNGDEFRGPPPERSRGCAGVLRGSSCNWTRHAFPSSQLAATRQPPRAPGSGRGCSTTTAHG